MKRFILTLSLVILMPSFFYAEKGKHTILILPFINKNNVVKYDYLRESLLNALTSELIQNENIEFSDQEKLNEILSMGKKDFSGYEKENNAVEIASKLNADAVIVGQYLIIDDKILIQMKALNVFTKMLIASTNIKGDLGTDIFRVIEESSKDISRKLSEKLSQGNMLNLRKLAERSKLEIDVNTAGVILSASGGVLFITGVPILIYDLAGYSSILREKKNQYDNDEIKFNEYTASYQIFIGLFSSGVTLTAVGFVMTAAGIPLIFYRSKKVDVSFYVSFKSSNDLFFRFSF